MLNDSKLPATTLIIFGITGDLAQRKLLPALAALERENHLPANFKLVGLSRRQVGAADVLTTQTSGLEKYLEMMRLDMANPDDYAQLAQQLPPDAQSIFYLSIPPVAVLPIIKHLSAAGLNGPASKLLLEKPFGFDQASAKELVEQTAQCFAEDQIYRIDHYMAKEMAQNIAVFLGSNALFRNIWNNNFIEAIDVIAAEQIGIEGRADFYEPTGALRDIVQSHLMNLAALTMMTPCESLFEFSDMPARRLEVLQQLKPASPSEVIRAQYEGYRGEVSNPGSTTETFVSVTVHSADSRWQGVPIRLITGKNLDAKLTEIRVHFTKTDAAEANTLTLRIQPEEGVEIDLWAKKPGYSQDLRNLPLTFNYAAGAEHLPSAYERVLVDAMRSRLNLFATSAEVLETWRVLQPVIDHWNMSASDLRLYQPGSNLDQVLHPNDVV